VAIGVVFAILGGAVLVAVIDPADDPAVTRNSNIAIDALPAGSWRTFNITATSASPATVSITWNSTGAVLVSWYAAGPCATPPHVCAELPALSTWGPPERSGSWTATGASGSAYILYVETSPSAPVNFSAFFAEHYRTSQLSLPIVPFAITLAGGAILVGVGGVLLYLGLFLPSGVYASYDEPDDAREPPESPSEPATSPPSGPPTGPGRS
jgi:hypothetical protein